MESCLGRNLHAPRSVSSRQRVTEQKLTGNSEGCTWKHEQGSEMMFDYMVKTDKIPISDKDARLIKALIAGEPAQCE